MPFSHRLHLRSQSVVGPMALLAASALSAACGAGAPRSDADEVGTENAQQDLAVESGRSASACGTVGSLGGHCSPRGAHGCAEHDPKQQLACDAHGVWQANGSCAEGDECNAASGPAAGSCKHSIAPCSHDDDSDHAPWHGRAWHGRERICVDERCVDERHRVRWQRFCREACTPEDTQCSGNGVQTCDASGRWASAVPCQYVCDAATGTCTGVCTPGAAQCSGNGVQTCDATGQWSAPAPCVNQACDAATGTCTGVCTPAATQCSGNGVQVCDATGQWGSAVPCVNQACDGATGTCTGVCAPGAAQCSGNGVQTCDPAGQWSAPAPCVNQACDGATGTCTGVCAPGAAQCSGNGVQTCDPAGQWGAGTICLYGCNAGSCNPVPPPPLPDCLQTSYAIPYSAQSCTQRQDVPGTGCGPTQPPECRDISGTASVALSNSASLGWQVTIAGMPMGPGAPGSGPYPLIGVGPRVWRAGNGGPFSGAFVQFQMDCGTRTASVQSTFPGSRYSMCYFTLPVTASGQCDAETCGGK